MHEETVTISKAKVEDVKRRIDAIDELAKKCLESCQRLAQLSKGEEK